MRDRGMAATAAVLTLILAACGGGAPSQAQIASTASVIVNQAESRTSQVKCSQLEWVRTIDIGTKFAGATVIVDQQAQAPNTRSVRIRNVGGFTGMFSQGDGTDAKTQFSNDTFTITGTAHGSNSEKPNEPMTATFKINVKC
ncbi:hypothetical protein MKUB_42940 [Mycobacterium kubicae]|uniref:Lipoprotein LpqH n=2 Tax=Mycobacterium kubicae TaxID=120959 RepID=A0AAX1J9L8_9MYCO|nr:lipoprotein LpqH [Mycobacterium kubicae]MCV7096305.1 lipoprotein LpqH [Mycobacterium kubicae]OBF18774.1 hypothetical protein A5725_01965 [Mycobacterium kubicae]QPI37121.1 lipoprotein LpqH [Mycobacterium kubicae]GFG66804.1 hypothetical protein MKUB_42940 [Mycobacterium kubicae]